MTQSTNIKSIIKRLAISPKQIVVGLVGAVFGLCALLSSWFEWSLGRDISFVGMSGAVLLVLFMLLRSLALKTASIRRDILRLSQRQASASQRIEASTGLSGVVAAQTASGEATVGNSLGHRGRYFGVGPEYDYAWRAAQAAPAYETFALRTRSLSMRDVLARAATGLQFNYKDLLQVVRSSRAVRMDNFSKVVGEWRVKGLLTLARVVANQRVLPNDAATAILLFEVVIQVFGVSALGRSDQRLYVEALVDDGRAREAARRIKEFKLTGKDPVQAALLTANLILPSGTDSADWTPWLEKINRVLAFEDAAPISLSAGAGTPLDRVQVAEQIAKPRKPRGRDPLVTVIVPTHNGSELIHTALASLHAQTWKNIEVIVVDDCSDAVHVQKLRQICGTYDNVLLLEQSVNGGAYLARNAALTHARGEFITVHDDDDWSHPEKIERQVTRLIEDPARMANMSMHTRVTDMLSFLRINNNTSFTQPNYSSIMFRRSSLDLIGKWDAVNRGADAEFRDRLKNVFGADVEVVGKVPMSFTRTRVGSLTHGELDRGYIDPARLIYLESYTQAHKQGIVGGKTERREFAAPLDMLPEWRGKHKGGFDVVYATDFRFPGGTTSLTIGEIKAAVGVGLRVGVVQLDSPLNKPGTPFSPALLNILLSSQAALLRVHDDFDAALLVVRHPSVAQFLDNTFSPARVSKCILIANTAPVLAGGSGSVYDLEQCVSNLSRCFNVDPSVVPESGVTRKLVEAVAGNVNVAAYDWPGFIDIRDEVDRRVGSRLPIVGRHSRDHRLKWPDTLQDFLGAYHQPSVFKTHILGGIDSIATSLPEAARQELAVTPFGGADVREYLLSLDFWVYYHSARTIESFGMAAAEAMEAGLIVILPEYMAATFGEGAVYAKPSEVASVVAKFWSDPALYREQSQRARNYVQNHYSSDVYASRLKDMISVKTIDDVDQAGISVGAL
ncbi:glycosyltransferase [Arthrobacter citreus]|uniref:glycosyltransferase family A protein n=1 Tax=Arthrobacter TaxID=1663 RepID=UPI00126514C5|nr:glycosyltransferase family A protein [Arthrobacter gandavensis]